MAVDYRLDPTENDSFVLTDGHILKLAQINEKQWIFVVPATAIEGQQQTEVRVIIKLPDDGKPGFYATSMSLSEYEG